MVMNIKSDGEEPEVAAQVQHALEARAQGRQQQGRGCRRPRGDEGQGEEHPRRPPPPKGADQEDEGAPAGQDQEGEQAGPIS